MGALVSRPRDDEKKESAQHKGRKHKTPASSVTPHEDFVRGVQIGQNLDQFLPHHLHLLADSGVGGVLIPANGGERAPLVRVPSDSCSLAGEGLTMTLGSVQSASSRDNRLDYRVASHGCNW